MGSRAIVVVCRDADVARERFGVDSGETGAIYTRTGRPFLDGHADTEAALSHVSRRRRGRRAVERARYRLARARLRADALVSEGDGADPAPVRGRWRRGARGLVGTRSRRSKPPRPEASRSDSCSTVSATGSSTSIATWMPTAATSGRSTASHDLRLAPFHILAAETGVFVDRDHAWHLERCDRLVAADPNWFQPTGRLRGRRHRRRGRGQGRRLVGGAHRQRWRGDGREADELHRARAQGSRSAGHQVPRPRVPAHHLRPRVHGSEPDRAPAHTRPRPQALACRPRVRARHRGARAVRPPASRSTASTNASSVSSRWRASRSTRGCDRIASQPGRAVSERLKGARCAAQITLRCTVCCEAERSDAERQECLCGQPGRLAGARILERWRGAQSEARSRDRARSSR